MTKEAKQGEPAAESIDAFQPLKGPEGVFAKDAKNTAKVMIGSKDEASITVTAQFNPKEIEIGQNVPWSKTNEANKSKSSKDAEGGIHMEFTGAEGRTLTLELLFDAYETPDKAKELVSQNIENLQKLAAVRKKDAKTEADKRPHHCVLVWGQVFFPADRFECVIQSVNVKYTMFGKDGQPLRATAVVKLAEANIVSVKKNTRR